MLQRVLAVGELAARDAESLPRVWLQRDDMLHPLVSGNKYRKLLGVLRLTSRPARPHAWADDGVARASRPAGVVSFGGAFSNHLHALAAAGHLLGGLPTVGIVRADRHVIDDASGHLLEREQPTLRDCVRWGMRLVRVDRDEYRRRDEPEYVAALARRFPGYIVVPEGGSCVAALDGFHALIDDIERALHADADADARQHTQPPRRRALVLCPAASGGTLAGVVAAIAARASRTDAAATPSYVSAALGVAVVRSDARPTYVADRVRALLDEANVAHARVPWSVRADEYHFGGYARCPVDLQRFCAAFVRATGVPVEPVYSGRMMYALVDLLRERAPELDGVTDVVAVHTGGLQGLAGLRYRRVLDPRIGDELARAAGI